MKLEKFEEVSQFLNERGWETLNSHLSFLFPKTPKEFSLIVRKRKIVLQIDWKMGKGWEIVSLSGSYPRVVRPKRLTRDMLEMIDFVAEANS